MIVRVEERPGIRAVHARAGDRPSRPALLALLAANAVPLAGVLYFDWSLFGVLLAYWAESGVVGLFNVPRILLALAGSGAGEAGSAPGRRLAAAAFFCLHYGGFWLAHGFLVLALFGDGRGGAGFFAMVAALVASHGVSFFANYIGRDERRTATPEGQMWTPYLRVGVLHLATLGGAYAVARTGSATGTLVLLVLLKTTADAAAHWAGHRRALARPGGLTRALPVGN